MARARIELEHARDFTGGLNLKDDPYNLGRTETFDLQNVDINRRGGFGLRRGSAKFIDTPTKRTITATGASRTGNVVTAVGLSPVNGDPGGLKVGQVITVTFTDTGYNGTFTVTGAVNGATTATWAQTAGDDGVAGPGTITTGISEPDSGHTFVDTSSTRHILVARGGIVLRWDGSAWQDVKNLVPSSGRTQFVEMLNVLYILPPGGDIPYTWTGSGLATQLTVAAANYNDDLTAPNDGNFPQCEVMAVHREVMWAGNVREVGPTTHGSRVRWSHPGRPQDWRTNDYVDLDPDDENGEIRALVPFGDRLLVFKDKSVYAIQGSAPGSIAVDNLTKEIGTPSQWSVVATEGVVYFWDTDTGAWSYDGKRFKHIFAPLFAMIEDNKINNAFSFQTIAEFHNERLWLSVPYAAPPYQDLFVSLVFDETASETGAWTVHTATLFGWWKHRGSSGGDVHLIGGYPFNGGGWLYELDVENLYEDEHSAGGFLPIEGWYTTRWFDGRNPAMKKRWKRPVVVMQGGAEQRTVVDVFSDYDPTSVTKTFSLITTLDGETGVWDDPGSDWDVAQWAAETSLGGHKSVIVNGSPLGGGAAKALRFKNTVQGQDWRIHGLTMKWIPRRIRG